MSEQTYLDFFLSSQAKLLAQRMRGRELEDLRVQAEMESRSFPMPGFLGQIVTPGKMTLAPLYSADEDSASAFRLRKNDFTDERAQGASVFGVFEVPGEEERVAGVSLLLKKIAPEKLIIRTGFFESEADIYETVLAGYRAVTIFARRLDVHQLQLCTEICRDMKVSCILVADSPESFDRVLETDCPYVGLWGFAAKEPTLQVSLFSQCAPNTPKNCISVGIAPDLTTGQIGDIKNVGLNLLLC